MNKNDKKNDNRGFSLVELIIVIAIMAILVGVLAPTLYKYVNKSKESTDITNLDTCVSVVQAAFAEEGIPSGGVTISGTSGGVFSSTNSATQAALTAGGAAATEVKGPWTSLSATISDTGEVTYAAAGGKYYQVKTGNHAFEPIP